jgi:hypothetical protein
MLRVLWTLWNVQNETGMVMCLADLQRYERGLEFLSILIWSGTWVHHFLPE